MSAFAPFRLLVVADMIHFFRKPKKDNNFRTLYIEKVVRF